MPKLDQDVRIWLLGGLVVVATAASTVVVFSLGSRGSEITTNVASLIAIVTGLLFLKDRWDKWRKSAKRNDVKSGRREEVSRDRQQLSRLQTRIIIAVSVAVGAATATAFWFGGGQADTNITPDVKMSSSSRLIDDDEIELVNRNGASAEQLSPPQRDNLAMRFSLDNVEPTGFCVGPAKVTFLMSVDGGSKKPVRVAHSGDEVELDLSEVTRSARVFAQISMEDKACKVDFRLDRAILFN